MNEEITDVKPPMGFPHITDLAGSEATILQVANSQGDILGYATLNDIDAYIEQKVSETVHSFSQKQIFQDVTINGTFDGNNVVNQSKLNGALGGLKTLLNPENIDGRDLNGVTTPGYYYSGFGNGCQNLPPDTVNCGEAWRGFILIVINVIGNYAQICIPRSNSSGFMENHIAYRRLEDYIGYWSGWTWL